MSRTNPETKFVLTEFTGGYYRKSLRDCLWLLFGSIVASGFPGSGWRKVLLVSFGARIGCGVVIKPRVRVKRPWLFRLGDSSWLGEGVWVDNVAPVVIGRNACVSQNVFICTGNHDYRSREFHENSASVVISSGVWIGAACVVCPGRRLPRNSFYKMGTVI